MGKQRTANAGVSIFAAEHRVEKKKRKASDMSIFDHVNQAQIMQQSMIQHAAPTLQGVANAAPTVGAPHAPMNAWNATMPAAAMNAYMAPNGGPRVAGAGAPAGGAGPALSMAAAAGVRMPLLRQMPRDAVQQLAGLPMRKTRSQQHRELAAMMMGPPPAVQHQQPSPLAPPPPRAATSAASALLPPPLPLQASVSDIASAFGLDSRSHDAHGPALGDSPMRRTRVSRTTSFGPDTSFGPRSDSFTPLPMQPSQSMANSGLDMLESLHDLSDPGFGVASSPAIIPGSPMRRTRSRGLAPLPLQTSISELVSSFIDGDSM